MPFKQLTLGLKSLRHAKTLPLRRDKVIKLST